MDREYVSRINQAIDYIVHNLDQNLTVEEIADHCCFSKFYFNRIFRLVTQESIYSFIKRLKLESAAFKLRSTRQSVTEIAMASGYSPSNFASAFKEYFGMNASEFRKTRRVPVKDPYLAVVDHIQSLRKQDDYFDRIDANITIRKKATMYLEYRRFIGNYINGLTPAWDGFRREMERKYGPNKEDGQYIGISYDDPLIADENHCIYDMCMAVPKITSVNTHKIEAGYYACYRFHDRLECLINSFNEIFALWLPFSPYRLDDKRLALEVYHSEVDDQGKMLLDICIPVQEPR
ncbi:MAG TPA: hypothetical protein DDW65_01935 [Firmicutes bacterium]|nr:hypothetical protein [Bacillota bacterium]